MNYHTLSHQIIKGESKTLEFKSALPKGDQLAKSIVAFANTSGGKIVIGVDDDRKMVGLNNVDVFDLIDQITNMIHDLCAPNLLPEVYVENINGTELLVIAVNRGALLPYYVKTKGRANGVFIRLGASNRLASAEYLQSLELQRLNLSFDEQINHQVSLAQLDLTPLTKAFDTAGMPLTIDKMRNLKLVVQQNEQDYPTHGLLILLGHYEHVEIKCSRFKGNTMAIFIDKKEYRGDLFSQLEAAESFIKNHLHLKVEILSLQRTETYEIPIPAVREALINAVLHRDYSNFGRDIKIGIYDDILNIVSPGGLPNGLTEVDLLQGRSEIRNRVLARVFKSLGYIEQWGSGINRIKQLCTNHGNHEPIITEKNDFVDWAMFRKDVEINEVRQRVASYITGNSNKVSEKYTQTPSNEQPYTSEKQPYNSEKKRKYSEKTIKPSEIALDFSENTKEVSEKHPVFSEIRSNSPNASPMVYKLTADKMLEFINLQPSISARQLAMNFQVTSRTIENHIAKLKKSGRLSRVGGARGGHWQVNH